jgi:biotin-(acetyl-CoA carboxylase) ligase
MTTNYNIKKLLETQETFRRQIEPLSTSMKAIEENSGIRRLIAEANRNQEMMRAALGPIEKLQRSGLLNSASQLGSEFQQMNKKIAEIEKRFRLPEIAESTKLFRQFENSGVSSVLKQYQQQAAKFQIAIESMQTPWLDMQDQFRSISGFVELQGIGHALQTIPAFEKHMTDVLRINLGDWRDKINWPKDIFSDAVARTTFYAERGLEPSLTAFPSMAFEQGIAIAGLKGTPPPLVQAYNSELKPEEDEDAFERTNEAHDRLQRFETHIRQFIDEQMKAAFGERWSKSQVPGDIRKAWLDKQQKARDHGEPELPLIAYSDFSDYVPIITRKDNWDTVFKPIFKRPMLVQESFQRLYPIRICTMHARLITQDDELYLLVETKRILKAIGIVT